MPAIAVAGGAADGGAAGPADNQRDAFGPNRARRESHVRELEEPAFVAWLVIAPQGLHYGDGFVGVGPALGEGHAHGFDLGVDNAHPDAQGDATAGQLIQGGGLFRQSHGIVVGQDQHTGAQDDPLGLRRGVGKNGQRVVVGPVPQTLVNVTDVEHVVTGPDGIVAEFLGAGGHAHHVLDVGETLVVGERKTDVHGKSSGWCPLSLDGRG